MNIFMIQKTKKFIFDYKISYLQKQKNKKEKKKKYYNTNKLAYYCFYN